VLKRLQSESPAERGQALVLMTVAFLALLAFVGLVTDVGSLYWSYGQLKRALDSAAVAASNEFRRGVTQTQMRDTAMEMLRLQDVTLADTTLDVFICDLNGDGLRDAQDSDGVAPWDGLPPGFYAICPDTGAGQIARKLVWIDAEQAAPVYFLHLFGVTSVNIDTSAVAEAATVDVVVVIDTSESMGAATTDYGEQDGSIFPGVCNNNRLSNPNDPNSPEKCRPLWDAKQAAKSLVNNLYDGYDRVSIVTFDVVASVPFNLDGNLGDDDGAQDGDAFAAIDNIQLHDDRVYSDFDPDDLGVGFDNSSPLDPNCNTLYPGYPQGACTAPDVTNNTVLSTCTGCGMKAAGDLLKAEGRPAGVWVIVFLSDGATNLGMHEDQPFTSDINATLATYPNGFCGGEPNAAMWTVPFCTDGDPATRHCGPMHPSAATCPPGSTYDTDSPAYDVEDFARDMVDRAALISATECLSYPGSICPGTEIAIYSIFLQSGTFSDDGEEMLRYMADIGTSGTRNPTDCATAPQQENCGQYYFVSSASQLIPVFEDIASRIFTRITN